MPMIHGMPTAIERGAVVEIDLPRSEFGPRAEATLREISEARTPRLFKDCAGRRYWLDEKGRIHQGKHVAGDRAMMRPFGGFVRTMPGRVLLTRLTRVAWDLASGSLLESVAVEQAQCRSEHVWLVRRYGATSRHAEIVSETHLEPGGHVLL